MANIERFRERLMALGGFQRGQHGERGGFWIDRDDVLRLVDEVLEPATTQGAVSAMEVARSALKRRMRSDDTLDLLPYDEDMADAVRRLDTALGGQ